MTDLEKLKSLTAEIDSMLSKRINPLSEEFVSWRTKLGRVLGRLYSEESNEYIGFKNTSFTSMVHIGGRDTGEENRAACQRALQKTRGKLTVYIEELEEDIEEQKSSDAKEDEMIMTDYTKVFIVHGHDGELREKVARILEKQNIKPIILSEQPNMGMTVIEKIEAYSENVGAAICLFTPDDEMKDGSKRARENVVFETGYFIGKIGRKNIIIISEDGVMSLNDMKGVIYVHKSNWELDVLKELKAIGYTVDLNELIK